MIFAFLFSRQATYNAFHSAFALHSVRFFFFLHLTNNTAAVAATAAAAAAADADASSQLCPVSVDRLTLVTRKNKDTKYNGRTDKRRTKKKKQIKLLAVECTSPFESLDTRLRTQHMCASM